VVDIGGSNIKILATGKIEPRKIPSSKNLASPQFSGH
jgi:hypothetical protein